MDEYKKANLALWNEYARLHPQTEFYDLQGFKAGRTSLNAMEIEEMGDVVGKTLLHLQCHFGMDTLSWARLGAKATGVDFSQEATDQATALNQELGLDAEFICSDIYELPEVLQGTFDIVYTSHGVLTWLPDLTRWAQVIARFLKPAGRFYIAESHPFADMFEQNESGTGLEFRYPYFSTAEPLEFDVQGSYADREAKVEQVKVYEWNHSLGDILGALIQAGLRIQYLHEYPFSVYPKFPDLMEEGVDGLWRLKGNLSELPLLFTLMATKE